MTKKRRLKRWVKVVIGVIVGIVLLGNLVSITNNLQEQELNEIKEYQQCIYNQHKEQSYIIRSNCSSNWKTLDKKANIEYKQVKMDLYLVSIDNLEI